MTAIAVLPVVQIPPEVGSVAVFVVPTQIGMVVETEIGCKGYTVTVAIALHVEPIE
jgi:hypothetical protein